MSAVTNSPIHEEAEYEKAISIFSKVIERLSKPAREEFANTFRKELKEFISEVAISLASHGKIHLSNRTILNVVLTSARARKWVLRKAKEEALQTLELIEVLEKMEPIIEKFTKEEVEEEVEEE